MKYIITVILLSLCYGPVWSQTVRMNNIATARTYTVENRSQTVQPLLQEAERAYRVLDFQESLFTLDNAVALNPNSSEALLLRARVKKMIGMQAEAEMDLRQANRINPYVANLYGYNGNDGLLRILAIAPEQAVGKLSSFQKLNYYYQSLDTKMILAEDKDKELELIGTVIEDIESENFNQAMNSIDEIIESFPTSAIAYDLKGLLLKREGKLEPAAAALERAVELEPNFAIAWYNLGQLERSRNNFEQAKTYLDIAIELQGDLTKAYFERALLYKQIGQKENALKDYNTIIEKKGNTYLEAFLNRGLTKKMLGDYNGALADLNQIMDEFPNNSEIRKNRGNLHLLFGLTEKAIDDYTIAINLDADYAEAYYNRGMAFFVLYDKVSGCADLDRGVELGYEAAKEASFYFCTE